MDTVFLRTDVRNEASMSLFGSAGFVPTGVFDTRKDLEERAYLYKTPCE
jgi:RimJ/RimL family protein N-acetyltransferase